MASDLFRAKLKRTFGLIIKNTYERNGKEVLLQVFSGTDSRLAGCIIYFHPFNSKKGVLEWL